MSETDALLRSNAAYAAGYTHGALPAPQRVPQRGHGLLIEGQFGGPPHCVSHDLFPANNPARQIHVLRTGLYALGRIKLES